MLQGMAKAVASRRVLEIEDGRQRWRDDLLAVEEPMEIRLHPAAAPFVRVAVTMRTPGHDFELAAGFLFTEGILADPAHVERISYCIDPTLDAAQRYNVVSVFLREHATFDEGRLTRRFYTTSSCGVCGKASIEAVQVQLPEGLPAGLVDDLRVDSTAIAAMGDRLREVQRWFGRTGGLHAAGLFDLRGDLVAAREDVGRHNAVDKVIGGAFLEGRLPLRQHVLMVSGRASFEIVQKAAMAGIPMVVAVSAPSSLACEAADALGITLVGFARGQRFNVYTHPQRVGLTARQEVTNLPG